MLRGFCFLRPITTARHLRCELIHITASAGPDRRGASGEVACPCCGIPVTMLLVVIRDRRITPARSGQINDSLEHLVKQQLFSAAVAVGLSLGSVAAHSDSTRASTDEDLAQIRSELQNLLQRVDKLEVENDTLKAENHELRLQTEQVSSQLAMAVDIPKPTAAKVAAADSPSRVAVKGDVRYRRQQTDDASASAKREEDLLRARLAVEARVNDRMTAALGIATSSAPGNPRGANAQLDGAFSRKSLYLDFAYFDWNIAGDAHLIGGKMKQPFARPGQSLFWDNDINPEGLAVTYTTGSMFGSAWSYWIEENVQTGTAASSATSTDTRMYGLQLGKHFDIGGDNLTVAATYYDLAAAEGRRPFYNGSASGNSLTPTGGLAYDFQVIALMGEYNTRIAGLPVQVWGDYAKNLDSVYHTAFTMGTMVGKASNPGSWETGLAYQLIEKDALFAQHIDSDFGGGLSDAEGWVFRTGFAPLKNWMLNATYFRAINNRNVGMQYHFDRLLLDFNTRF
jgi:hypothetical protein